MNKFIPMILLLVCGLVVGIGYLSMSGSDDATPVAKSQAPLPLPEGHVNRPESISLSESTAYSSQLKGTAAAVTAVERKVDNKLATMDQKILQEVTQAADLAVQRQLPVIERKLREEIRREEQAKARQEAAAMLPPTQTNRVVDTTTSPAAVPLEAPKPIETPATGKPTRILDLANAGVPSGFGFDELNGNTLHWPGKNRADVSLMSLNPPGAGITGGRPGYVKISAWQPNQSLPTAASRSPNAAFPDTGAPATPASTPEIAKNETASQPKPKPIYTIENTATLFSNTTMTALMGVVPNRNNAVKNLMRFKLITGADNIASNGLYLPDVRNIIWTGYVIGNREMECVNATVDTITFTFKDGTISTVSKKQASAGGGLSEGLGYLSDRWGKPCIRGTLISNATQYLRDRMIAAGAAATASAAAATETTTLRDGATGGTATAVTGDQGNFIAGKTGTATLNELADYLRDRMDQAIDIVYLDPGKDVTIHVEDEIPIDYNPVGRKLSHVAMAPATHPARRIRLD